MLQVNNNKKTFASNAVCFGFYYLHNIWSKIKSFWRRKCFLFFFFAEDTQSCVICSFYTKMALFVCIKFETKQNKIRKWENFFLFFCLFVNAWRKPLKNATAHYVATMVVCYRKEHLVLCLKFLYQNKKQKNFFCLNLYKRQSLPQFKNYFGTSING